MVVETNPAGVVLNQEVDKSVAGAAEQMLQSGILDEATYEPRNEPAQTEQEANTDEGQVENIEEEAEEQPQELQESEQPEVEEVEEPVEIEEPLYPVNISGKHESVTLDELKNGYQRGRDYTQKTQELSKSRKEFEAERQAVLQKEQQYQAALQQFDQILAQQKSEYETIDWNQLAAEDPTLFVLKQKEYQDLQMREMQSKQEQERILTEQQKEIQRRHQDMVRDESEKLVSAFPDFLDAGKRDSLRQKWTDYALSQGYGKEEFDAVVDHRAFVILDKAMKYDKIQQATTKKAKVNKVPKTARPGTKQSDTRATTGKFKKNIKTLRQTGKVDDAARVLFDRL